MSIRLLLVDDQELVRTGFRLFLETQDDLEVVGEAGDGAEAIERARELRPDVILMDIRMPEMDGVEATARLTSAGIEPPPRVLVLTTFDLDEYVFGALRAGAADYEALRGPKSTWRSGVSWCVFCERATARGYETGTSARARAGTRGHWRHTANGRFAGKRARECPRVYAVTA